MKALEAFQQRQARGPVRAKRALDGCKCGKIPQLIRLEGERITFGATFDEKKAVMPLSIDASRIEACRCMMSTASNRRVQGQVDISSVWIAEPQEVQISV